MHRIDSANHSSNQFVDRNLGTSTPGTVLDAAWLNAAQEEIANAVEDSGQTLEKGTNDQLSKAMGLNGGSGGAREFSDSVTVDVESGDAITGATAGSGTAAGVKGVSELGTGVSGTTQDGAGVRAAVGMGGTGVALDIEGPIASYGEANVIRLGEYSTDGSFPSSPVPGMLVYLGGANQKAYVYSPAGGGTWHALW